ncbi:MAG: ABC transporter substrate-binding protein [Methylobacter sp.]|uniref:ABC transporter substrate-binding protein n=1 Tax=Candidatus Methylobacter titanis TaxID=3053457 RepID=A0AA43TMT5_9GAMM|nr:ABC transporter substrate-binding protein [Candidatus Methylobacter titanis]
MRNLTDRQVITGVLFAIFLGLLFSTKAIAEDLLPPQQVIQNVSSQLQQKMKDKSFTRDFAQVVRFVNGVIDPHIAFNQVAQLVLGRHWKTATPQEQERFKDEFQTLLVRTYSRAFVEYTDWSMRFRPIQVPNAATRIMVRTDILQPGRQAVEVNYRMLLNSGEWKVYDIMIDGVSLVTNYRTTFNDYIQRKGSLSIVIDDLAKRNTEALSGKSS